MTILSISWCTTGSGLRVRLIQGRRRATCNRPSTPSDADHRRDRHHSTVDLSPMHRPATLTLTAWPLRAFGAVAAVTAAPAPINGRGRLIITATIREILWIVIVVSYRDRES